MAYLDCISNGYILSKIILLLWMVRIILNILFENTLLPLKRLFNAINLDGIYLFKVNKENMIKMCEICLKLAMKTTEGRQ